jgi:hypothetical protein
MRAVRDDRVPEKTQAMVLSHPLLRRPSPRRSGQARRLAGTRAPDAEKLDRQERRGGGDLSARRARRLALVFHDASRHAIRRDLHRDRGRPSLGRRDSEARGEGGGGESLQPARAGAPGPGAREGRVYEGGILHRMLRGEPGDKFEDSGVSRELCAHGVRHGGGHGGAGAR